MIQFPSKMKNLSYDRYSFKQENNCIRVTFDYEDETGEKLAYDSHTAIRESNDVCVTEVGPGINGFRRVVYSNNKIGFQNVETGEFVLYKFCIASDFDDNGFAMVGMVDGVTWIDKEFNRLTSKGTWMPLDQGYPHAMITQITNFVSGVSTILCNNHSRKSSFFMNTKGEQVEFAGVSRQAVSSEGEFSSTPEFNEDGYYISSNGVFFANGKFIPFEKIVKLPETAEILRAIGEGLIEVSPEQKESGRQMTMKSIGDGTHK